MSNHPHFAVRTVRNGQVKIGGKTFRLKPHGHTPGLTTQAIEGMRFAFGRYWSADECLPMVCLWGTEEEFRYKGDDWAEKAFARPYAPGGVLIYNWWEQVGA